MERKTKGIPPGFYRGTINHVSSNPSGTRLTIKAKLDNGLKIRSVLRLSSE